jgi:hypothetical protein
MVPTPANDDLAPKEVAGIPGTVPAEEQPPVQAKTYDFTGQDPDFWLHAYEERASIREFEGGMSREQAEHLAYDEVLLAWHKAYYRPRAGYCAGCQEQLSVNDTILLADCATIHNTRLHCASEYKTKWRTVASLGLSLLGIDEPITWSTFEREKS